MDRGKASAQGLNVAQETRLAPQGMPQVAQSIKDVACAGEKHADRYHQNLNKRAMWQGERAGQSTEEAEEKNTAR